MDVRFLSNFVDSYMIKRNVFREFSEDQIELTKSVLIKEVSELVTFLKENDIELYDMIYDKPRKFQLNVLESYFDEQFISEEQLNEIDVLIGSIILTLLVSFLTRNRIAGYAFKQLNNIGEFFDGIGKWMSKHGKYAQFRYKIINQNAADCYKQCGVDSQELTMFSYFSLRDKPPILGLTTEESFSTARCLRECYLSFIIESIGILTDNYFICLKQTGSFDKVQNIHSNELVKLFHIKNSISGHCEEYFNSSKEAFDKFDTLLDFLFEDRGKKQDARTRLRERLIKSRDFVSRQRVDNNPKFQQKRRN